MYTTVETNEDEFAQAEELMWEENRSKGSHTSINKNTKLPSYKGSMTKG